MLDYGFAIYETTGDTPGRIVRNGHADQSVHIMSQPVNEGEELYPVFLDQRTQYVDLSTGESAERPTYFEPQYLLPVDEQLVVTGIPEGVRIEFQGEEVISDGSDFEFSSSVPGLFRFLITPQWPGQAQEVGILVR